MASDRDLLPRLPNLAGGDLLPRLVRSRKHPQHPALCPTCQRLHKQGRRRALRTARRHAHNRQLVALDLAFGDEPPTRQGAPIFHNRSLRLTAAAAQPPPLDARAYTATGGEATGGGGGGGDGGGGDGGGGDGGVPPETPIRATGADRVVPGADRVVTGTDRGGSSLGRPGDVLAPCR